ncbi:hypothetical protein QCN29_23950 [Streptomyces sp. HNM0663]|uniref:Uncharacterized protein n=1 Tax=Streptomyces chengmaiensis TaxID=3040919 RepID=A0ABT6HSV2_9ACTN|nr:hypothetical protein [Streptomyces chengmaiensis]MDH2391776.1 hypothetical protein [Streptomyces chengmaiensis]
MWWKSRRRTGLWAVAGAAVLVVGTGASAGAGGGIAPEADVAHHGHVTVLDGRLEVSLHSRSHGPASLDGATVRLRFSEPLAGAQKLPGRCLWGGDRVVMCGLGELRAGGAARQVRLDLRTVGAPDEVVMEIDTMWNGGASDRNPSNNEHRVLAPATGDPYAF